MGSIVNSYLYKLFRSKTLYVLLIIAVLLPIFTTVVIKGIVTLFGDIFGMGGIDSDLLSGMLGNTLMTLGKRIMPASDYSILIIVGLAIFFGKDYSDGTIRNTIIAGKSRTQIYFSFLVISVLFLVLVLTASYISEIIISLALFPLNMSWTKFFASCAVSYGLMLIVNIFVATVTLFFVVIFKRVALAIVFPILTFSVLSGFLMTVYSIFLISGTLDLQKLAWIPLLQYFAYDPSILDAAIIAKIVAITSALIAIFAVSGWQILNKSDIK